VGLYTLGYNTLGINTLRINTQGIPKIRPAQWLQAEKGDEGMGCWCVWCLGWGVWALVWGEV
jgi:hypothetical protein